MANTPLSEAAIWRGLTTDIIGRHLVILNVVGSTNDWLKAAATEDAVEGLVVFAEEQTVGRGQVGRPWVAPARCCILMSVLFRPNLAPDQLACLGMLGACAAAAAATEVTGLSVALRWPNDLITAHGKLGGVLTESSTVDGQVEHVILGIGLNVNLSRRALMAIPGATSLQAEGGRLVNRNALARALLRGLDERYGLVQSGQLDAIFDEWRERLATIGKWVRLRTGTEVEEPLFAVQATDRGSLILRRADGSRFEAVAGDMSVREFP